MFRCQLCQCVVPPRTPCHRLVVKRRPKEYPYRHGVIPVVRTSDTGKRSLTRRGDPGGVGHEIVSEVNACPACAGPRGPG